MALTDDDKERVKRTLGKFGEKAADNMCLFYEILLKNNPQYHSMFYNLKHISLGDIKDSQWVREKQGPKVGGSVGELVANMDDSVALKEGICRLVNMTPHLKYKLTTANYAGAFKDLVAAMQIALGDDMTQEDVDAWLKLAGILIKMIDDEMNEEYE